MNEKGGLEGNSGDLAAKNRSMPEGTPEFHEEALEHFGLSEDGEYEFVVNADFCKTVYGLTCIVAKTKKFRAEINYDADYPVFVIQLKKSHGQAT